MFTVYLQARHWGNSPSIQVQFLEKLAQTRRKTRQTWLSKIFRNCTPIKCKHRFTYRYCTVREFDTLYTQTLFRYPDAYFHEKAQYLKKGNSATVIRTHLGDRELVIKRFNRKNWIKRLKRYFTPSKAARAWKMSHAMETIGIATPKPLAFIEKRFGPIALDSYFISEYTPGERLDHLDSLSDCAQALNNMMDALDSAMCAHGDLKASNMLWDGEKLYLLDTDAAKFYKSRQKFKSAHDADWKRLLKNWDSPFRPGGKNG
jgi:tRNA A-37 threonylcarbamoyl transferase component Bud32